MTGLSKPVPITQVISHDGLHHREFSIQHEQLKRLRAAAGLAINDLDLAKATDRLSDAFHREILDPCAAGMVLHIGGCTYVNLGIPAGQKKITDEIRQLVLVSAEQLLKKNLSNGPIEETVSSASVVEAPLDTTKFLLARLMQSGKPMGMLFTIGIQSGQASNRVLEVAAEFFSPVLIAIDALLTYRNTDPLTGLYNQRHMKETLQQHLMLGERHKTPTSFVMMDLNHFKLINDQFGHPAGNRVLVTFGKRLRNSIRYSDTACRYGGDEFAVILPSTGAAGAAQLVSRIRDLLCVSISYDAEHIPVSFSYGTAVAEPGAPARSAEALVKEADKMLYLEKGSS